MKVKELIKKLMEMDPEADVYVEALDEPSANKVKQYSIESGNIVYIADTTEYLDSEIRTTLNSRSSFRNKTFALDLFVEEEVPFRLKEQLYVSDEDIEKVEEEILDKLCLGRGGDFDFIDNDSLDSFIIDILEEKNIEYGG